MREGNELEKLLSSFSCKKDEDIEYFLQNRAIEFEKLSKARTYLVFDQDELEMNDSKIPLTIYGYECRKEKKLVQFYEQNLFSEIARIPDNEQPMVQMIRKII